MSRVFQWSAGGIRAQFEPAEVELLHQLEQGVSQSLDRGSATDPVIERLFPTAVSGDQDADAEVRELLRDDLLESRRAGLEALNRILERATPHRGRLRVQLVDDEPLLVLGVLNDLRLAIGASIGIEQIEREAVTDDDPVAYRLAVMDHLGWWQEQLLDLLGRQDPPDSEHPPPDELGERP